MMKTRRSGLSIAAKITGVANRVLDIILVLVIAAALLYSGYGLYDTWQVYNKGSNSDLLKYKPGIGDTLSFSELQAINPDVCAWLTVDDTSIDYPVVQGSTNQTYLNKDVFGEFSLAGSIFLDSRCSRDFTDFYSLIHGHHMDGNIMFGQLPEFLEDDFFESHTTGTLYGNDFDYRIEWFACFVTDAYDDMAYNPQSFDDCDTEEKESLLSYIKESAAEYQYREIGVSASDQIIGLSTCERALTAGRVLLYGRLIPIEG
jgi:sortase B